MALLDAFWRLFQPARASEPDHPRQETPARRREDPVLSTVTAVLESGRRITAPPPWWLPREDAGLPAEPTRPQPIDRRLYEQVVAALDDPNLELPQLPDVAQKVMHSIRDDGGDMRRAAQFAARDPVLAAEILRLANSAAFRGVREITRLDAAFVRLGQKHVRSVLLAATMKNLAILVGRKQKSVGEQLWISSWASGLILAHLSRRCGMAEEDAFLLGLLHDIGKLAVLKVTHDFQSTSGAGITRRLFDTICRRWHEHLGARIATAWNLPDPLPLVIGSHHRLPEPDDPLARPRLMVQVADVICGLLGYAPYEPCRFFELPCVQRLGLTDAPETHALLRPLPELLKDRMQI